MNRDRKDLMYSFVTAIRHLWQLVLKINYAKSYYNPHVKDVPIGTLSLSSISSAELIRTYPYIQIKFLNEKYEIKREDTGQLPGLGDSYDGLVAELHLKRTLALSPNFLSNNSVTIHPSFKRIKPLIL